MIDKNEIIELIDSVKVGDFPVNRRTNLLDDGILDSFSILVFIAELNSNHGINISLDEEVRTIFSNVDSIYDYVNSQV